METLENPVHILDGNTKGLFREGQMGGVMGRLGWDGLRASLWLARSLLGLGFGSLCWVGEGNVVVGVGERE